MRDLQPWMPLTLGTILFFVGLAGVIIRKNILMILMSIELMLNAVNLTFVVFSDLHADLTGQTAVLFIMVVAASEAAVGLALLVALFRRLRGLDTSDIQMMRE